MNIDCNGIRLRRNANFTKRDVTIADADIAFDDLQMSVFNCPLRLRGEEVTLHPPAVERGKSPIMWRTTSPHMRAAAAKAFAMYRAVGGAVPSERPGDTYVLDGEGCIVRTNEDYDEFEAGGLKWIGLPKQDSGVLRTLKVESEICDRAGL